MDELTQLLLASVAGRQDASLPDLVAQSLGDDPLAGPLAAALREREAREGPDEVEVADPEVSDVLDRLYEELERLRDRNRVLADALGACARCFGEDELCPVCRGRGRPGGRQPDGALFRELVEPAWRRHEGFPDHVLAAAQTE